MIGGEEMTTTKRDGIPGNTPEAGREICKLLGVEPRKVLRINIFVLHNTVVIKTIDGEVYGSLIPERNEAGELILRVVKD